MRIPLLYTVSHFKARRLTTLITVCGIALVVFVFAAVLMMAFGVQKTLQATGSSSNVIVFRKSSTGEISSVIDRDTRSLIETLPYVASTAAGTPINSGEPVVVINLEKPNGGFTNVTVRGVSEAVGLLRPQVELVEGVPFNPQVRELIVGSEIAARFPEARVGRTLTFAGSQWRIVGRFDAGGSGFDSEIWGDATQLLGAFNRGGAVSTITLRLDEAASYTQFKRVFDAERRLQQFDAKVETDYFGDQSEGLAGFIRIMGTVITFIFAIGATVGAMITMYASVANRSVEIGTLRALGFQRMSILTVFLIEALLIALLGGAAGLFLASFLQFFTISTLNFQSFSELAFSFTLSPAIVVAALLWAVVMGLLGGFLPAVRASRLKIVDTLRARG